MPFQVIDTIRNLTDADIALLKANGITGVSRYIARTSSIGKIMGRAECNRIVAAGLALMINYEQSAGDWQGGGAKGASDGAWARSYVRNVLGLPDSVVIIQSIDTGVSSGQLPVAAAYQQAFNAAGGQGPQGCYGPRNVLEHLAGQGLLKVAWEWMGVAGQASTPVANIRQYRNKPYSLPFTYDSNTPITPYYGQYTGQSQELDVPFSADDVNVLRKIAEQTVHDVWAYKLTGRFGFPDDIAEHYLVDARAAAGYSQQGVVDLSAKVDSLAAKVDNLAVGGVDLVALAELVRAQVRAELDATRFTGDR